nr:hypothetical protein [uncultured Allomuricauda sp.]
MGSAVEAQNVLNRERKLEERLHYGWRSNRIYFGNTGDYKSPAAQRKAVRRMINRPGTHGLFLERNKRRN